MGLYWSRVGQYNWCPYERGKFDHSTHPGRLPHTQENSYSQAKERGLEQNLLSKLSEGINHVGGLILDFQTPEL